MTDKLQVCLRADYLTTYRVAVLEDLSNKKIEQSSKPVGSDDSFAGGQDDVKHLIEELKRATTMANVSPCASFLPDGVASELQCGVSWDIVG